MKITAIKQQERLKGRYSVFVDEKYTFSLSEGALLDQKLHIGQELTKEQVSSYKKLSADDKAYGLTLAYVARRMRSQWELTDYFKRKGYAEELGAEIMEKLERLGFVDDEAFARSWVENRRLLKPISKRRLSQELRQKRITDEIIDQVLAEDETDELDTLRGLVVRKRRQTKYQDNLKLMQYLAGQGFNYGDIKAVLESEGEED
jgi:regulatory protein